MKNKFIILICAFFCAVNLFAAKMTEVGVGVYIYDNLMRKSAETWGRDPNEFVAEHFAILEKNGINLIHLAIESLDSFEKFYIPLMEKHKINALIQINYAYFRNNGDWKNPKYMDSMAKKAAVIINKYKNHPNVVGFSIREEAGTWQMKQISDYYKNIFKYTDHVNTFICHNNIAAARAHLEPYPEIFGTDRYNFYFNGGKNAYLASPASAINWLRNQGKSYYVEAAKRNADFMMVLTQGGFLNVYPDVKKSVKDENYRKQINKWADNESMGWFRVKQGYPAHWAWYRMPANCLKACMWVSVLEGAKYITFYSYIPPKKGFTDIDTIADILPRNPKRTHARTDFYTLAGHPDKPNPQLAEFAETAKELKVYGKLIMKMKKVINDKEPVIKITDFRSHYAQRFTVDGIKGNVTVFCNVKVGTWPQMRHLFKEGDKVRFDKFGQMADYVPRKGLDMMSIEAKLDKGESVWRLDTMEEIKDGKIGIKPGSGIMLFSGTKAEFIKLQKII